MNKSIDFEGSKKLCILVLACGPLLPKFFSIDFSHVFILDGPCLFYRPLNLVQHIGLDLGPHGSGQNSTHDQ